MNLKDRLRTVNPGVVTMPEYFRSNGYETAAAGKIFDPRNVDSRVKDDPASWSIPFKPAHGRVDKKDGAKKKGKRALVSLAIDAPQDEFVDGMILNQGKNLLQKLSKGNKPFFLAVGFKKPHLPFYVPSKYFDMYDPAELNLASLQEMPRNAKAKYLSNKNNELRNAYFPSDANSYGSYTGKPLNDAWQREMVHGYYAATSFIDDLTGQLLSALDESGVADNTIVVFWGDHGFHLGDHGQWTKHTTFEQANHVPMMIRVPGLKGKNIGAVAESIDLFPTLLDLAGLAPLDVLQGVSQVKVMTGEAEKARDAAISQYPAAGAMGYSLRTEQYRYIEWYHKKSGELVNINLYDMVNDPLESENLADKPELAATVKELAALMQANSEGLALGKK